MPARRKLDRSTAVNPITEKPFHTFDSWWRESGYEYDAGLAADGPPNRYVAWDHRVIIVCHSALRRRVRWWSLMRRRAKVLRRIRCPECKRWATVELSETTNESKAWQFDDAEPAEPAEPAELAAPPFFLSLAGVAVLA